MKILNILKVHLLLICLVIAVGCSKDETDFTSKEIKNITQKAAVDYTLETNLTAIASSIERAGLEAKYATDGNTGTRWSSAFSDNQWIYVDLKKNKSINRVVLNWETAAAKAYKIQVSGDAITWTTVYDQTNGAPGIADINFNAVNGRYVRMLGVTRTTPYGFSLYEFNVYTASISKAVPGTIEAEDYEAMSGIQLEPCSDNGLGYNVGWTDAGDWLEYSINVASTGYYTIDFRSASQPGGGSLDVLVDENKLTSVSFPNTGAWQNWVTVTSSAMQLSAGTHKLKLLVKQGLFNLNWLQFKSQNNSITRKVLVINFDPILTTQGNQRLHTYLGCADPYTTTLSYIDNLKQSSGGYLNFEIYQYLNVNEFPVKADGFQYTEASFLACRQSNSGWHFPDEVDYNKIIRDYNLNTLISNGTIHEVIIWGAGYFGYYESIMVGNSAYWCNSVGIIQPGIPNYIIMGLNYEVGVDNAIHSFGHRTESIMVHVYGSWSSDNTINHLWDKFTRFEKIAPGLSGCGNIHFPPNANADYDYSNTSVVTSNADDWANNFPNFTNTKRNFSSSEWGSSQLGYLNWWFSHLPRKEGRNSDGKLNNWWEYIVNMNAYPESR